MADAICLLTFSSFIDQSWHFQPKHSNARPTHIGPDGTEATTPERCREESELLSPQQRRRPQTRPRHAWGRPPHHRQAIGLSLLPLRDRTIRAPGVVVVAVVRPASLLELRRPESRNRKPELFLFRPGEGLTVIAMVGAMVGAKAASLPDGRTPRPEGGTGTGTGLRGRLVTRGRPKPVAGAPVAVCLPGRRRRTRTSPTVAAARIDHTRAVASRDTELAGPRFIGLDHRLRSAVENQPPTPLQRRRPTRRVSFISRERVCWTTSRQRSGYHRLSGDTWHPAVVSRTAVGVGQRLAGARPLHPRQKIGCVGQAPVATDLFRRCPCRVRLSQPIVPRGSAHQPPRD